MLRYVPVLSAYHIMGGIRKEYLFTRLRLRGHVCLWAVPGYSHLDRSYELPPIRRVPKCVPNMYVWPPADHRLIYALNL